MQKLKIMKNKLLIILLIAGCGLALAFKTPSKNGAPQYWCYMTGVDTNPASYVACTGPICASGTIHICAILANADPSNPNEPLIDSGLASRISNKDTSMGDVFLRR